MITKFFGRTNKNKFLKELKKVYPAGSIDEKVIEELEKEIDEKTETATKEEIDSLF